MAGKVTKPNEVPFEERLEQLENIAGKMEQGNLPLHELVAAYEEGAKLAAGLREELDRVQARMMEIKLTQGERPEPSDAIDQASVLDSAELEE
ncbi:MAG: exodeoxyribonuclease VII small subunit [Clostridia bacterium]|nr:exodeoxyribonuclease VII small subunit [Clostridia bacterium]